METRSSLADAWELGTTIKFIEHKQKSRFGAKLQKM